uniref:Uncharacterized protein n=1 Tax=Eptatretus burgeri TaxID=7764 RepID=A0A8C4N9E2_EPTBU
MVSQSPRPFTRSQPVQSHGQVHRRLTKPPVWPPGPSNHPSGHLVPQTTRLVTWSLKSPIQSTRSGHPVPRIARMVSQSPRPFTRSQPVQSHGQVHRRLTKPPVWPPGPSNHPSGHLVPQTTRPVTWSLKPPVRSPGPSNHPSGHLVPQTTRPVTWSLKPSIRPPGPSNHPSGDLVPQTARPATWSLKPPVRRPGPSNRPSGHSAGHQYYLPAVIRRLLEHSRKTTHSTWFIGTRPVRNSASTKPPYIFIVPLGPKLVRSTSCKPRAALIFTAKAARARATSALGLSAVIAAIFTNK